MGAFRKIQSSYFYSFLLHAGLVLLALIFSVRQNERKHVERPQYTVIEVDPLPKSAPTSTRKQVVQTEKGKRVKEAAPDSFLGEQTQVTEKQIVSMPKTGNAPKASEGRQKTEAVAETPSPKTPSVVPMTGSLAKFGIAISATQDESPKPKRQNQIEEASLTAQVRGEYVKGFKQGESTLLNTREFVFYGYFQRVRERLDRAWERTLRERLAKYFRRGRQLASEQDYMTQIMVSLDPSGKIIRVQIIGASGTKDLDDAAIKAFNDAGPFPNPPHGLVDNTGQVLIRWDFVLKT